MDSALAPAKVFRFGLFEADIAHDTLTRNGVRVKIQDQPFRVLLLLLERPGEILTREELRQKLWPEGTYVDFDGSLNVILKKLRAAIDDDSDNPRFIETVPRRGYRFIAPVSVAHSNAGISSARLATPSPQQTNLQAAATSPAPSETKSMGARAPALSAAKGSLPLSEKRQQAGSRSRILICTAAALVVAVASSALWFALRHKSAAAKNTASSSTTRATVPIRKSVAVLGFHNVSGRVSDSWLATAFSEMLSTELAGGEKLRLVSGEDVANLRHSSPWSQTDTLGQETTSRIGTNLNADLLVLGSFTTVGKRESGQLRLDVRLQEAKTGEILAEVAEIGSTEDVFQIVSRAGGKLRNRLGMPRLEDTDQASIIASLPANSEALRFYSLGLVKLREYDYLAARVLFEQATKADPKFPLAYSMLSRADIWLGHDDLAKTEAKRGLTLAGSLSRVQRMEIEASYCQANAERGKAAEIYRALFNLFPDSLDYGLQLAKLQLESYHPDEALGTIRQLRQLPEPARDDPGIDLREAGILLRNDAEAADRLFHSAAVKAAAQQKSLVYAKAEWALCWTNRQHLQSPPECQQAYQASLAAGNRDQAASSLQLMAEAQRQTNHDREAVPLYQQALGMFREIGDREEIGVTLNNLGLVLESEGQWNQAEKNYREAKQNFAVVKDMANTAEADANTANILVIRGHLREASDLYRQGWQIADASQRARHEYEHIQFAALLLMQGEVKAAQREVEPQVASLRAYSGDPWQLANALIKLGDVEKSEGNLLDARKNYQEAAEILKKANASVVGAEVALAELSTDEGRPDLAENLLRQGIADYKRDKSAEDETRAHAALSRALLAKGNPAEAREQINQALSLTDLREFPILRLPLEILRARAKVATEKPGASRRQSIQSGLQELRSAVLKSQQLGLYGISCEARLAEGEAEMRLNPESGRLLLSALAKYSRSRGLELLARQAEQVVNAGKNVVAVGQPAK